jgi:hypothetical protein
MVSSKIAKGLLKTQEDGIPRQIETFSPSKVRH